jgi:hypothetical protein
MCSRVKCVIVKAVVPECPLTYYRWLGCSVSMQCVFVQREFSKNGVSEGVAGHVRERMASIAEGRAPTGTRPMLLFPEVHL